MKVKNLIQTCDACPSQWEFTTDENRPVYVRYRRGYLSVYVGGPDKGIDSALDGVEVVGERIGDAYDGVLDWSEVESRIKDINIFKQPKCPSCQSTRVSGRYAPMWVKYCPIQKCYDCGYDFKVNQITGEVIKQEKHKPC